MQADRVVRQGVGKGHLSVTGQRMVTAHDHRQPIRAIRHTAQALGVAAHGADTQVRYTISDPFHNAPG